MSEAAAIAAVSRFTAFATLTDADFVDLQTLAGGMRHVRRGQFICREGDRPAGFYLLLEGWTASSMSFADGSRQMLKVHLPGDMLGLPGLALTRTADSILALTDVTVGVVPRAAIGHLFELNPRLAAILFLISQEERVAMIDRLASVGATDAINRLAALMLNIHARLRRSDPSVGDAFSFPLAQADIADLIGVTTVHLNRVLQQMRAAGLILLTRKVLTILNRDQMIALAGLPDRELDRDADWLPGRAFEASKDDRNRLPLRAITT